MRLFASTLLAAASAFAYQVTYPGGSGDWNTTGPNFLMWQRVDTDPLNFTVVLTNQNIAYNQILDTLINGALGSVQCSTPSGGWPSGSDFRVNLAQDAENLDTLLAQSDQFNITAVSSNGSTTSAQAATSTVTPGVSSSDTSTTPTGTSAASLGADTQTGLFTAVAALTALITALF